MLLKGIRILDLSRVLAGPFATMTLADMGAEVIKIENPVGGDETRTWGPPFVGTETAIFFLLIEIRRVWHSTSSMKKEWSLLEN